MMGSTVDAVELPKRIVQSPPEQTIPTRAHTPIPPTPENCPARAPDSPDKPPCKHARHLRHQAAAQGPRPGTPRHTSTQNPPHEPSNPLRISSGSPTSRRASVTVSAPGGVFVARGALQTSLCDCFLQFAPLRRNCSSRSWKTRPRNCACVSPVCCWPR
jgi:hypothetical protein